MGLIPTLTSFTPATTADANQVNANFTSVRDTFNSFAVLTDTAKTIAAAHTWSLAQTWSVANSFPGLTSTNGLTVSSGTASFGRTDVAGAQAILVLNESDQSLNNKKWRFYVEGAVCAFQVWDDAESATNNVFSATRSGATVSGLTIAPATTFTSSVTTTSLIASSTAPLQRWFESDGGVDGKFWTMAVNGGVQTFRVDNDADNSTTAWLTVTRAAMVISSVVFTPAVTLTGGFTASAASAVTGTLTVTGTVNASVALTAGTTITAGTGLTVTAGGATISAGGATITGNSTIAGTLGSLTGLTVTSGLTSLPAAAAGGSTFRIPHGSNPTSPTNGDIWTTNTGLFLQVNGATVGPLSSSAALAFAYGSTNGTGVTPSLSTWTDLNLAGSTSSQNLTVGSFTLTPTSTAADFGFNCRVAVTAGTPATWGLRIIDALSRVWSEHWYSGSNANPMNITALLRQMGSGGTASWKVQVQSTTASCTFAMGDFFGRVLT